MLEWEYTRTNYALRYVQAPLWSTSKFQTILTAGSNMDSCLIRLAVASQSDFGFFHADFGFQVSMGVSELGLRCKLHKRSKWRFSFSSGDHIGLLIAYKIQPSLVCCLHFEHIVKFYSDTMMSFWCSSSTTNLARDHFTVRISCNFLHTLQQGETRTGISAVAKEANNMMCFVSCTNVLAALIVAGVP